MNVLNKIFSSAAAGLVNSVGGVLDNLITSKEEKLKAKQAITKLIQSNMLSLFKLQSDIVKTEMTGNWLQRSWRPILMLSFGFIILYYYFIAPVFGTPGIELPEKFWTLLNIGIGGYVVGRSAEKIFKSNPNLIKKK